MFKHRAEYTRLINTARWRDTRRMILARERGLCADCAAMGIYTAAREVHHIHPVEWERTPEAMERRMFDPTNLVALCHDCHRRRHRELAAKGLQPQREREFDRLARRFDALTNPHG